MKIVPKIILILVAFFMLSVSDTFAASVKINGGIFNVKDNSKILNSLVEVLCLH